MKSPPKILAAMLVAALIAAWPFGVQGQGGESEPARSPVAAPEVNPQDFTIVNLDDYGGHRFTTVVSDKVLGLFDQVGTVPVHPTVITMRVDDPALFNHPFAFMSGHGTFEFDEGDIGVLRPYLENGGCLLACACHGDELWDTTFRREIARVLPDSRLARIPGSHPLFRTVYELPKLEGKDKTPDLYLEGITIDGRLAVIYTRFGLNASWVEPPRMKKNQVIVGECGWFKLRVASVNMANNGDIGMQRPFRREIKKSVNRVNLGHFNTYLDKHPLGFFEYNTELQFYFLEHRWGPNRWFSTDPKHCILKKESYERWSYRWEDMVSGGSFDDVAFEVYRDGEDYREKGFTDDCAKKLTVNIFMYALMY